MDLRSKIVLGICAVALAGLGPSLAFADTMRGRLESAGDPQKPKGCSISTAEGTTFTCSPPIPSNVHVGTTGGTRPQPSGWGLGIILSGNVFTLNLVGSSASQTFDDTVLLIVVPTNLVSTMTFTPAGGTAVVVSASSFLAVPLSFAVPGAANLHPVADSLPLLGISVSSGLSVAFVDLGHTLTSGLQVNFSGVPKGTVIYAYGANKGALAIGTPNSEAGVFFPSAVPEPASITLLGGGLLALARRLRNKKS